LTPAPSSDPPESSSPVFSENEPGKGKNKENGLPSPVKPDSDEADRVSSEIAGVSSSSPVRKVTFANSSIVI
jgi:DNA mismatch repair protein MSH6